MKTKYIIITGGVLSGLGKGVTGASIGFFFSEKYKVTPVKLDGYLNTDPGTMNPIEHGEVFVLDDGFEVDMDFGHYERFINCIPNRDQSLTMGKVFSEVREKERRGDYLGQTVQMIPHVTDSIQDSIIALAKKKKSEIMLIEVGGTVGDIESELYIEALRQLQKKVGPENVLFIHLTYIPIPTGVNEQKTKPTQQSVNLLQNRGVWPAIIIGRSSEYLSESTKNKIGLFSGVSKDNVFSAPDLDSIYKLPEEFSKQKLGERIAKELKIKYPTQEKMKVWSKLLNSEMRKSIKIIIAGKYTDLEDSYASIIEALKHCSYNLKTKIDIEWLDTSSKLDKAKLRKADAIIVPGGFGTRGVEGKIEVIKYARTNKIPYLGICYGLQLAVVEFARNVCHIKNASSIEFNPKSKDHVVTMLDEQRNVVDMGGTMRLGGYDAKVRGEVRKLYQKFKLGKTEGNDFIVSERHRHRYEVNPSYIQKLKNKGLMVSGISKDRELVEFIELPKMEHPYFIATQAHPELKSKLEKPAPLFYGLVKAAIERN